jgi:hypothetical protein
MILIYLCCLEKIINVYKKIFFLKDRKIEDLKVIETEQVDFLVIFVTFSYFIITT